VSVGHRGSSKLLVVLSVVVVAVLAAPLAFLLVEASGAGLSTVISLIWRPLTRSLLWNTVRLMAVVTALCGMIGTLAAFFVERTDLPGRRIFAVLVVLPFAIPDFVVSFGWFSISTWVQGFQGAVLVMTLALYPLVYLPVAAGLRSADPALEEAARSLGCPRGSTFCRVTLGQVRGAILGGCILVALVLLAEYGAFEILGYPTFTTEIFSEFQQSFNVPASCALSLVLVAFSVVLLGGETFVRSRGPAERTSSLAQRAVTRYRLGRARWPVAAAFVALVGLSLGVPIGSCLYWMARGGSSGSGSGSFSAGISGASLVDAGLHTAGYGLFAAALATSMALPVALYSVRHGGRIARLLERSTYLVLAMPGVVIALAVGYFALRYANGFAYQSAPLLVLAYSILFFPLALVGVRASVTYAPVALEEAARSLGERPVKVFLRVTLPLVAPGLGAAFCLVFLSVVTELTATLLLVPTGVQTLSTQFWAYEQNLFYGQAAPFALVMIAIAVVPSYVVSRYFDRLPERAKGVGRPAVGAEIRVADTRARVAA
jgi:iron(III) transport system permease protein